MKVLNFLLVLAVIPDNLRSLSSPENDPFTITIKVTQAIELVKLYLEDFQNEVFYSEGYIKVFTPSTNPLTIQFMVCANIISEPFTVNQNTFEILDEQFFNSIEGVRIIHCPEWIDRNFFLTVVVNPAFTTEFVHFTLVTPTVQNLQVLGRPERNPYFLRLH